MNMDKINQWLTLAANLSVLAGILFLALELNQNGQMMRTQTRNAISDSIINFQLNSVSSGLQALAYKANSDPSSLTREESQNVLLFYVANLRLWENIYYQYRNGLFDEAEFEAESSSWRALGERTPLLRSAYCVLKPQGSLSSDFVKEMDTLSYDDPGSCEFKFQLSYPQNVSQP